ncbi:MAG: tRNA preQ1(34) S-adenosylmethionine ribosyltransferase-isomerase QueA [Limisphaerales bacterium]
MRTADFDFDLPAELIAQQPLPVRDASRLLVVDRTARAWSHRGIRDLPALLGPGDLLVVNNSRVFPARIRGRRAETGGETELLLLQETPDATWWAMVRPGKRLRPGARIALPGGAAAEVLEKNAEGHARLRFTGTADLRAWLEVHGEIPLPPYIRRAAPDAADRDRYQTVYARATGSAAAPTAGLHFTPALLDALTAAGLGRAEVTLHVGLGTFAPVKAERMADHVMHEEAYEVPPETAAACAAARARGGRVVAVGTTALRVLESVAAEQGGRIVAGAGRTRIFIRPPHRFQAVDALLTNFHLPRSTLLMLVSAYADPGGYAGRDFILSAYAEAVREGYRFFSYGDAMLLL